MLFFDISVEIAGFFKKLKRLPPDASTGADICYSEALPEASKLARAAKINRAAVMQWKMKSTPSKAEGRKIRNPPTRGW